jgi:predicted component of type VI protein secretion system
VAVTIVVRSASAGGRQLTLTLDAPRVVIGRGEGCELRLPDLSVDHRHASIRQRGGEYVVVDEGSVNGTFLGVGGEVRLPAQAPRVVKSGELVRVGRVWLEIRIEPAVVKGSTAAAAKELALALVGRGLAAQGEEPGPRVTVLDGKGQGGALVLAEPGRAYAVGRGKDTDLPLDDPQASLRHVTLTLRGDAILVTDTSAGATAMIAEARVGRDTPWRVGQVLTVGRTRLGFDYLAAEALLELEQSPVERMQPGEAERAPAAPAVPGDEGEAPASARTSSASASKAEPASEALASCRTPISRELAKAEGGWSLTDGAVVLLAVAVLALSGLAAYWLFMR